MKWWAAQPAFSSVAPITISNVHGVTSNLSPSRSGLKGGAWDQRSRPCTKSAFQDVIGLLAVSTRVGLQLYPESVMCTISNEPIVGLDFNQAEAIMSALEVEGIGGSTPMAKGMRNARNAIMSDPAPGNKIVMLTADGKPSDTCMEDCTGCDCTYVDRHLVRAPTAKRISEAQSKTRTYLPSESRDLSGRRAGRPPVTSSGSPRSVSLLQRHLVHATQAAGRDAEQPAKLAAELRGAAVADLVGGVPRRGPGDKQRPRAVQAQALDELKR